MQLTSTTLGRFCRELACGLDQVEVLLAEWGVTEEQFALVQKSPAFQNEMAVVEAEMRELGADAGYIYRMKSLCEDMLPDFVKMYKDVAISPNQKFEMMKWAAEMARLKEKNVPRGTADMPGPRGPTVVFQFGAGLPIQSMQVVAQPDAQPVDANSIDSGVFPFSPVPSLRTAPIIGPPLLMPDAPQPAGPAPRSAPELEGFE